jgi:hypothetical protein
MQNKFTFDLKTRNVSATCYVQASFDYECQCGHKLKITTEWPENLTVDGEVNFANIGCPKCKKPVSLAKAHYWVENFQLLSKSVE